MKFLLIAISLLMSITAIATPASYSYKVYVLPPFGKVLINNKITCPNTREMNCKVANQPVDSIISITGIKDHTCSYRVNADGSLMKDEEQSFFCTGYTISATENSAGEIHLPNHF